MEGNEVGGVATRSAAMQRALARCRLYAPYTRPIVVVGPVGSGKSLLAQVIYQAAQLPGPFVAFTGGGSPEGLYHGSLFGAVRGAFTDAMDSRGLLEAAQGGMLFFDDVAQLPLTAQVALLRVLDSGCFRRLGATEEGSIRCRLVFASTEAPSDLVVSGRMLPDFASRLGALIVEVPALAERSEDILPMAHAFATALVREHGKATTIQIADDAAEALLAHAWPENVRELKAVIERAVVHALNPGGVTDIRRAHLLDHLDRVGARALRASTKLDYELVLRTVQKHGGNQSAAARELGVHRNTVAEWLARGPRGLAG